jgi:uncharacterized protein (TIRG00374 family)
MKRVLRILVTVGLLALIVRTTGGVESLVSQIASVAPAAIVVVLLLNTVNRALMAYKWLRLLAHRGQHLALVRGIKIYCSSIIWGMFLPATVGADAIRAACTVREGLPGQEVIASIAIERIIGSLATPLLAIGGLMLVRGSGHLDPRLEPVWWTSLGILVAGVAALLLVFDERFHGLLHYRLMGRWQKLKLFQLLERSHATFRSYRAARRELAIFFVLTVIENSFPIVVTWIIAQGLGVSVPFMQVAAAVPLAYLVARVPFSMGGIGVYESVFVLILAAAGVSPEDALAIALLARVLQILAWLPWWFAYVAEGGRRAVPR